MNDVNVLSVFKRIGIVVTVMVFVVPMMVAVGSEEDRPIWISQPKSSDMMYIYAVGHAAKQPSEEDAKSAAFKDALSKFASQVTLPDGNEASPSQIHGAELVPGCAYVEKKRSKYEAWVQISWPTKARKSLEHGGKSRKPNISSNDDVNTDKSNTVTTDKNNETTTDSSNTTMTDNNNSSKSAPDKELTSTVNDISAIFQDADSFKKGISLVSPDVQSAYAEIMENDKTAGERMTRILATRKYLRTDGNTAIYEVADGKQKFLVFFQKNEDGWKLISFL